MDNNHDGYLRSSLLDAINLESAYKFGDAEFDEINKAARQNKTVMDAAHNLNLIISSMMHGGLSREDSVRVICALLSRP